MSSEKVSLKTSIALIALFSLVCILAAGFYIRYEEPQDASGPFSVSSLLELNAWHNALLESRFPTVFKVGRYQVFTIKNTRPQNARLRQRLFGRFESSPPDVQAIIITPDELNPMERGYPPLQVLARIQQGRDFSVVIPSGLWDMVFVQVPKEPNLEAARTPMQLFVMSMEGLANSLPSAARVSSDISLYTQLYGTNADVKKLQRIVIERGAR